MKKITNFDILQYFKMYWIILNLHKQLNIYKAKMQSDLLNFALPQ